MSTITILDPVTRVEGHLRLKITVSSGRVESAQAQGTMYRGFENLLKGKSPDDARILTQRICGVCPASHGLVAADAIERMKGLRLPANAVVLRNLLLGAEFLHTHILHFYHLCVPDFIRMPESSPWGAAYGADRRLSSEEDAEICSHAMEAFRHLRSAHTIGALVGGRMPHATGIALGGMSAPLRPAASETIANLLAELEAFVQGKMVPDAKKLASAYADYFSIGKGTGNFLCFGAFPSPSSGKLMFQKGFRSIGHGPPTPPAPLLIDKVTESIACSWYSGSGMPQNPFQETTVPAPEKENGYSWIKAPRYMGKVCEVGPFARLAMLGLVKTNSSVMGRILARVAETAVLVQAMKKWLDLYTPDGPVREPAEPPAFGTSIGLGEAPRGSLAHYVTLAGGAIDKYQIVTPTSWNCSPRDGQGTPGVAEKAAAGTPVSNEQAPIEVVRVLHSFDPCMACSVH